MQGCLEYGDNIGKCEYNVCPVFVSIGTCITLRLSVWPDVFFYECFAAMFIYYAAHWQTYCSGTLHFIKLVFPLFLTHAGCKNR